LIIRILLQVLAELERLFGGASPPKKAAAKKALAEPTGKEE